MCLSHHGFVRLLQHLKRYVCPRSLWSDHISGDLRVAWARALGQRVDPPPTRERRGPIGQARGSEASGVPKFGGRGIVRSSCSFGTHMASPFSFLGRQCCLGTLISLSLPRDQAPTLSMVVQMIFFYFGMSPAAAAVLIGIKQRRIILIINF